MLRCTAVGVDGGVGELCWCAAIDVACGGTYLLNALTSFCCCSAIESHR